MFRTLREMIRVRTHLADLASARSTVISQSQLIAQQAERLQHAAQAADQARLLEHLKVTLTHVEKRIFSPDAIEEYSPHFKRNLLPSDDAALQKMLIAFWATSTKPVLDYPDILASGFRVFSQNDEDGALLRIFSKIGTTNHYVLEIGSNCSGSDVGIPENLSTNLIVNHGWHGVIVELDAAECEKMRYFFSRNLATKHYHIAENGKHSYFSPLILQREVTPDSIDAIFAEARSPAEPDLFIIDIDGGDYAVVKRLSNVRPRVIVVEFEKRFRDRFSVVQPDRAHFSQRFPQSGTVSLKAWRRLLDTRGYTLVAIATCGFNAYFVRSDIAEGRIASLEVQAAFDGHPLLAHAPESLWLEPDETWVEVGHKDSPAG